MLRLSAINPLSAQTGLGAFGKEASNVNVSGLTSLDGGLNGLTAPFHYWNSFQAYDDGFLVKGNHSIKFGVAVERVQHNSHFLNRINGVFNFGSYVRLSHESTDHLHGIASRDYA